MKTGQQPTFGRLRSLAMMEFCVAGDWVDSLNGRGRPGPLG